MVGLEYVVEERKDVEVEVEVLVLLDRRIETFERGSGALATVLLQYNISEQKER